MCVCVCVGVSGWVIEHSLLLMDVCVCVGVCVSG